VDLARLGAVAGHGGRRCAPRGLAERTSLSTPSSSWKGSVTNPHGQKRLTKSPHRFVGPRRGMIRGCGPSPRVCLRQPDWEAARPWGKVCLLIPATSLATRPPLSIAPSMNPGHLRAVADPAIKSRPSGSQILCS
jgi:hypothetical protein